MIETAYYLNNISDKEITLTLTAKRVIPAKSSLKLNNKDIIIFKTLKAKRTGRVTLLDNLRLSTIPIEKDSNYSKNDAKVAKVSKETLKAKLETQANEEIVDEPEVQNFLEGLTNEVPEGTEELSTQEAQQLEAQAMRELEANIVETSETAEVPENTSVEVPENVPVETPEQTTDTKNEKSERTKNKRAKNAQ